MVTKDELLGTIWIGNFVEEGNLPVHISKLRRALGESKAERFIETAQGTGYRLIAPVESVSPDVWQKQLSGNSRRHTDKSTAGLGSIAVLPLRNESDNAEIDYLADGLTESFINALSQISELKVIARDTVFRYKGKEYDSKNVGETLGVSAVLTGRIKRLKDNLMIGVELVNVDDGSQIWGTQFNQPFADILKIQEEITKTVSTKLRSEIEPSLSQPSLQPITQDAESYRLYLKGKYFQEKRTESSIYIAIECLRDSITHDSKNVLSYVEIAECYRFLYILDNISYEETLVKINPLL